MLKKTTAVILTLVMLVTILSVAVQALPNLKVNQVYKTFIPKILLKDEGRWLKT